MAKNKPYKGFSKSEINRLLKCAKDVPSFGSPKYVAMHKSVVQEIQAQKERNTKIAQKSSNMMIFR